MNRRRQKVKCIFFDGNIGAGKTTILNKSCELMMKKGLRIKIISENYKEFDKYGAGHQPLTLSSRDPLRNYVASQLHVHRCMLQNFRKQIKQEKSETIFICDRGIFSHLAFIYAAFNSNVVSQFTNDFLIESSLNQIKKVFKDDANIQLDILGLVFIYCSPEKCLERSKRRVRPFEDDLNLPYLEALDHGHEKYLSWYANTKWLNNRKHRLITSSARKIIKVDNSSDCNDDFIDIRSEVLVDKIYNDFDVVT